MTLTAGALRADPGFRRYRAARALSRVGSLITAVVLPVLVYRLTWSVGWTAAVVVLQALPHLLLAPAATAIAARVHRRTLLVTTDLLGAALLISIPLAWWYQVTTPTHVVAVAAAVQVVFLVSEAGHRSALTALTGAGSTGAGQLALRHATSLAELMVPALAGLAVAVVAPAPLFAPHALSLVASALLVRAALRGRSCAGRGTGAQTGPRAGLRVLRRRAARPLVLVGTLHAAAGAAFLAVLLPWADQHLGVPPYGDARLALVVSCWGLGVIVGHALATQLLRWRAPAWVVRRALIASLLCALGVLLSTHWLPAILVALLWGAAQTVTAAAIIATLRVRTGGAAPAARSAARLLWDGAGPALGAALAGVVAVCFDPRAGLAVGPALLAAAMVAAPSDGPARARQATGRAPRASPGTLADRAEHADSPRDRRAPRVRIS